MPVIRHQEIKKMNCKIKSRRITVKHKVKVLHRLVRRSWSSAYRKAVRLIECELGYEIYGDACLLK